MINKLKSKEFLFDSKPSQGEGGLKNFNSIAYLAALPQGNNADESYIHEEMDRDLKPPEMKTTGIHLE